MGLSTRSRSWPAKLHIEHQMSKSELNFPGNVSIGSNGVATVADTDNDRILIWKTFPKMDRPLI